MAWAEDGSALLQRLRHHALQADAQRAMQDAARLKRLFPGSPQAIEADYWIGRLQEKRGAFRKALEAYSRFMKQRALNVFRVDARLRSALIRQGLRDPRTRALSVMMEAMDLRAASGFRQAMAKLEQLAETWPDSPLADDALNMLAYIQLLDARDAAAAEQTCRLLMERYPRSSYFDSALYSLGVALETQRRRDEARKAYLRLKSRHERRVLGVAMVRDDFLSRVWVNKAEARLDRIRIRDRIAREGRRIVREQGFVMGVGDRLVWDMPVGSGRNQQPIWMLMDRLGLRSPMVTHWITRQTDWQWETPDRLRELVRAGHTPVIVDWYFGDEISPAFVRRHQAAYLAHVRDRLIPLIRDLPEVWVMLEPEFNKHGIDHWPTWGKLALQVLRMIHREVPGARVGYVLGNWADAQGEWIKIMKDAFNESDFIGFQEMVSAVDANAAMEVGWSPVDRSMRLIRRLHEAFHKPVYFAYLAVSSAYSWEGRQAGMIEMFHAAMPEMAYYGAVGASWFSLLDDPRHQGWFGEAEKHLGLATAQGRPKPSLRAWRSWEKSAGDAEDAPPRLFSGLEVRGGVLQAGKAVILDARLKDWARWKITVRGRKSKAEREFWGAGRRVHAVWKGWANRGMFADEECEVRLQAWGVNGKSLSVAARDPCRVAMGGGVRRVHGFKMTESPMIDHWGDFESGVFRDGWHLAWRAGASGMALWPGGSQNGLRLEPKRDALRLRVRLPAGALAGVKVGIEDANGRRASLLLGAYIDPRRLGVWQDALIPLVDFLTVGGDRMDWEHVRNLVMFSTSRPAALDMQTLEILRMGED